MKELKSNYLEKTLKENLESVRNQVLMIIANSIFNILTKVSSMIIKKPMQKIDYIICSFGLIQTLMQNYHLDIFV